MSVALTDTRLTTRCSRNNARTVDVFFDDQLVTRAQGTGGRAFSDDNVVVPGDATPGQHRFELSCNDVGPWIASTSFDVTTAPNHPMGWITSLPRPGNLQNSPLTWVASLGIAVLLLAMILIYLVGFPSKWFNSTYAANEERIRAAARRRFPRVLALSDAHASAARGLRAITVPVVFLLFVALSALIHSTLDPKFGLNASSLWLWLGWCCGVTVVVFGFHLPAMVLGVRTQRTFRFRMLMGSLLVGALFVLVSRWLKLEPGYCYGLIAVFVFRPVLPERESGRVAAISAVFILLLSLVAWIVWVPLQRAASHPHPSPGLLVVEAAMGVVFILGIESVSFGMLPLPFLPGRDVVRWSRPVWAGVFGLGMTAFAWTLLQPGSGYAHEVRHLALIPVAVTCAGFVLLTVALMAYFHYRPPRPAPAGDSPAPLGLAD
jgi:hypothetical protein